MQLLPPREHLSAVRQQVGCPGQVCGAERGHLVGVAAARTVQPNFKLLAGGTSDPTMRCLIWELSVGR